MDALPPSAPPEGTKTALPAPAHQFQSLEQQHQSSTLGMWVFLVTEVMFFGALFTAYAVYRTLYPEAFSQASRHLDVALGTVNTCVLITSSLTMALAVHGAEKGRRGLQVCFLGATILLGLVFLGIKTHEYVMKFEEGLIPGPAFRFEGPFYRHAQLFFLLYFIMTGVHAVHMVAGEGLLLALVVLAARGRFSPERHAPVELTGLYWHFVDIIWIFLFPLLYLLGRQ